MKLSILTIFLFFQATSYCEPIDDAKQALQDLKDQILPELANAMAVTDALTTTIVELKQNVTYESLSKIIQITKPLNDDLIATLQAAEAAQIDVTPCTKTEQDEFNDLQVNSHVDILDCVAIVDEEVTALISIIHQDLDYNVNTELTSVATDLDSCGVDNDCITKIIARIYDDTTRLAKMISDQLDDGNRYVERSETDFAKCKNENLDDFESRAAYLSNDMIQCIQEKISTVK